MGKKKQEEAGGGAGWIVSFADLMTLLFAAFVVLYALKQDGEDKTVEQIVVQTAAIREAFNEVPDDIPEETTSTPLVTGRKVFKQVKAMMMRKPVIKQFLQRNQVLNIIDKDMKIIKELIKNLISTPKEASQGKSDGISIAREDDGIKLTLMATHFYKPGAFRVHRKGLRKLAKVGLALKQLGRKISIEGHTDSSGYQGKFSAWEISSLRAGFIVKYFVNELDYPAELLRASGYGDSKPIATNSTADGRRLNRRMEIKIHYD